MQGQLVNMAPQRITSAGGRMVSAEIDIMDRGLSPLFERMELDRMLGVLYRQLREVTQRPGSILFYELHHDATNRSMLVMQLIPEHEYWRQQEIIEEIFEHVCDYDTWGVSSLLEGTYQRGDDRRLMRGRIVRENDLGAYMRGYFR